MCVSVCVCVCVHWPGMEKQTGLFSPLCPTSREVFYATVRRVLCHPCSPQHDFLFQSLCYNTRQNTLIQPKAQEHPIKQKAIIGKFVGLCLVFDAFSSVVMSYETFRAFCSVLCVLKCPFSFSCFLRCLQKL